MQYKEKPRIHAFFFFWIVSVEMNGFKPKPPTPKVFLYQPCYQGAKWDDVNE